MHICNEDSILAKALEWEKHFRSVPKFEAFYRTVDRSIKLNSKRLCAQQLYRACRWQMSWSYFTSLGKQKFEEVSSVQNLWQSYLNLSEEDQQVEVKAIYWRTAPKTNYHFSESCRLLTQQFWHGWFLKYAGHVIY